MSLTIGGDDGLVSVDTGTSSGGSDDKSLVGIGSGDTLLDVDTSDDADSLVTLFGNGNGSGGQPLVDVGNGDGLLGVDTSGDADAVVTLFGSGSGGAASVNGQRVVDVGEGDNLLAIDTSGDALVTLFGSDAGVDDTQTGSIGGGGNGGGAGNAPGTGGVMPDRPAAGAAGKVATRAGAAANASCFTPNEQQISHLLSRTSYDGSVTAQWAEADSVSIVPVNLCPDARARVSAAVEADASFAALRAGVTADADIIASLQPNYGAEDVLGVDASGDSLTVYVY